MFSNVVKYKGRLNEVALQNFYRQIFCLIYAGMAELVAFPPNAAGGGLSEVEMA